MLLEIRGDEKGAAHYRTMLKNYNIADSRKLANIRCNFTILEQVTRGHNIVADGWAGASNPYPHSDIHKKYLKRSFFHFSTRSSRTNGRTDGWTNGQTDKASYRVACPQLKTINCGCRSVIHFFMRESIIFSCGHATL